MYRAPGPQLLTRSLLPSPQEAEQEDQELQGLHSGQLLSLQALVSWLSPGHSPSSPEHLLLLLSSPSPHVTLQELQELQELHSGHSLVPQLSNSWMGPKH